MRILHGLEDGLLVLTLAAMILFSFGQIALRNLVGLGVAWFEPLLRHLVLWIALLGAMVAARSNKHLCVDAVTAFLPPRPRMALSVITDCFTSVVCALLAWASTLTVLDLYDWPPQGSFGDQAWIFALVLPLGFSVMALRYLAWAVRHAMAAFTGRMPEGDFHCARPKSPEKDA